MITLCTFHHNLPSAAGLASLHLNFLLLYEVLLAEVVYKSYIMVPVFLLKMKRDYAHFTHHTHKILSYFIVQGGLNIFFH